MNLWSYVKEWGISILVTTAFIFGIIWTFADPIGLQQGWVLFFIILLTSIILSTFYTLIKALIKGQNTIRTLTKDIENKNQEVNELRTRISYCCVVDQKTSICPLGVTAIIPQMKTTVTSSIEEAQNSFKWLGLSSFNVIHNNKDIFARKKSVQFEFVIANPLNDELAKEVDIFYGDVKGRLGAKKLMTESASLLLEFIENVNPNIKVIHYNQMPTLRVILVDNKKAYVSFYERGIDALESVQLEIENNPDAQFSLYKWFPMFYEKVLITEKLMAPK